jgi:signal transduction histidine kinase
MRTALMNRRVNAYLAAVVAVGAATASTIALRPWMGGSVSIFYFPAVIIAAVYGGYGPGIVSTVLATAALAFFFIPPTHSMKIGADDALRLVVFAVVATATSSLSTALKRAEDARRRSFHELETALATLKKVSGWPLVAGSRLSEGARRVLEHAATVMGATSSVAVWEAEDEPWRYVAVASYPISKRPPTELSPVVPAPLEHAAIMCSAPLDEQVTVIVHDRGAEATWRGVPVHPDLLVHLRDAGFASAPFQVEHLKGRVFFSGIGQVTADIFPLVVLVAREIGNSLDQLFLHERLQQVAIREDRIRLARDLHDGVLQALTGIRLQLQTLADEQPPPSSFSERLFAVERAIATEQRELRAFIEDLKPVAGALRGDVAQHLEELRRRLAAEWKTTIVVRVEPANLALPPSTDSAVRLMVREAVVNALKHAHPSRVAVDVRSDGSDRLQVVVSDDGRGFPFRGRRDHEALVASNEGPASLRDRVVSLGGTLAIESQPTGSRLEITVPVVIQHT